MKRPLRRGAITCVPLQNAVLCGDCECISESTNDVCEICGGRALVNLGRLLGSAAQAEAPVATPVSEPMLGREFETLTDSTSRGLHVAPRRAH
jgi:hypothetical protein